MNQLHMKHTNNYNKTWETSKPHDMCGSIHGEPLCNG